MTPGVPFSRRHALHAGTVLAGGLALTTYGLTDRAYARAPDRLATPWHVGLTRAQQAGQRTIFSYPGPDVPDSLLAQIADGQVGGVIFFGENIESLDQIAQVCEQLNQAHAESPTAAWPLLLMTDQEGGYIRRLRGAEPILSEKDVGLSDDPLAEATHAGAGAGAALLGVGMNHNLAPVQDVYREEGNFDDQWERSYSTDPEVCGALGAAFVTAQQRTGVVATAKHFPGLGAATADQNTDLGPVELDLPAHELRAVDEAAFIPPIAAGVDMVMTSWATYPALDRDRPAGLSRHIVHGELRRRLRFRGITITDALEAGATVPFGDTGRRSVLAAQAGMDVLLCSGRDVAQGEETVAAVADALASQDRKSVV